MIGAFLLGVAVAVVAGLILYYGFGIGRGKKPVPLSRALKIELDNHGVGFNSTLTGGDHLVEKFSVTINLRINNLSAKKITLRNINATLQLPEGYEDKNPFHTNLSSSGINGEDFVSGNFAFMGKIPREGSSQGTREWFEWLANRGRILEGLPTARLIFRLTGEAVSNDDLVPINQEFDITQEILPKLKT